MRNENNLTGTRATRNAGIFRVREKRIVNSSPPVRTADSGCHRQAAGYRHTLSSVHCSPYLSLN